MLRFFVKLSIFILISFLLSCDKYKYNNTSSFSLSDIQETIHLTGEIIDNNEIFRPRFIFIKDSLLFTINLQQHSFVTVFHLQDMKKIGDYIDFGSGPNEVLNVSNIQFQDSLVWALDQMSQKINSYQVNQFLEGKEAIPQEIIRIEEPFDKLIVTRNKLIANSLRHIQSRFSFYDLEGNFIGNNGELPNTGIEMTDLELFQAYFCNMVLHPNDESIFVAYLNTDLIEIYDSNGNIKTRMHGPDQFYSIKKEVSLGDNMKRVTSIEGETRDAYACPVAFEDEIWTIYDGKYFDRNVENSFLCNRIIIFDWEGNPIRQYITDIAFYALAVDRQNRAFYGITLNPEHTFVKFNY